MLVTYGRFLRHDSEFHDLKRTGKRKIFAMYLECGGYTVMIVWCSKSMAGLTAKGGLHGGVVSLEDPMTFAACSADSLWQM